VSESSEKGSPTRNGAIAKSSVCMPPFAQEDQPGLTTRSTQSPPPAPSISDFEKKKQTFITRTIWTFVMMAMFFGALFAGHIYIIMIITAVQIISFKEVIGIINVPSRARSLRFTKSLNWYFLGTAMYFLYGESVIYYFKHIILIDRILLPFATHHRFISFILYIFGM
jgi:phosphatidate cytidylyltransferase